MDSRRVYIYISCVVACVAFTAAYVNNFAQNKNEAPHEVLRGAPKPPSDQTQKKSVLESTRLPVSHAMLPTGATGDLPQPPSKTRSPKPLERWPEVSNSNPADVSQAAPRTPASVTEATPSPVANKIPDSSIESSVALMTPELRPEAVKRPLEDSAKEQAADATRSANDSKPNATSTDHQEFSELRNHLSFLLGYSFTNLSATDRANNTSATLQTSQEVLLGAGLTQDWRSKFQSFENFSVRMLDFQPPNDANIELAGAKKSLVSLRVGGEESLGQWFSLQGSAGFENDLSIHALNSSTISIDSFAQPTAGLLLQSHLYRQGGAILNANLSANYLFGGNDQGFKISPGEQYGASICLNQQLSGKSLEVSLGAFERLQDSTITRQTEQNFLMTVKFGFSILEK